jgi:hypothetical protein
MIDAMISLHRIDQHLLVYRTVVESYSEDVIQAEKDAFGAQECGQ